MWKFVRKASVLVAICAIFGFSVSSCSKQESGTQSKEYSIDLYNINDFHGTFDENSKSGQAGLRKISSYLKSKATSNLYNFIFSSGDMWQGSADSNLTKGKLVTESMNEIGFDAMCLGNHEFDWGEEAIIENKALMNFSLLNCNIFYKNTANRPSYIAPSAIIEKGDLKIGVIGSIMHGIESSIIKTTADLFDFQEEASYIKNESDSLYEKGADAVILLAHNGNSQAYEGLCTVSPKSNRMYINAGFLGHDHQIHKDTINGVPFVEGSSNGRYISHISLKLKKGDENEISNFTKEVIETKTNCLIEDEKISNIYSKYEKQISTVKNEKIGVLKKDMSSGEVATLANRAMIGLINSKPNEFKHIVYGSFINSGASRSNLYAGSINYGDIIKCLPFDNQVCLLKVNENQYNSYYNSYIRYVPGAVKYDNGYTYIATVDYVALKDGNYMECFTSNYIIRDVVKMLIQDGSFSDLFE